MLTQSHGPHTLMDGHVAAKPFSGKFEEKRKGKLQVSGVMARDQAGRVFQKFHVPGLLGWRQVQMFAISDPVSGHLFSGDPRSNVCTRSPMGFASHPATASGPVDRERKTIEGLSCYRLATAGLEVWISEDLNQVVLERSADYDWRLYDVVAGDPDPALFVPPAGFRIVG